MNTLNRKNSVITGVAALAALVGVIIYIVTSTTGYLAASAMGAWPIICTIAAVVLAAVVIVMNQKMPTLLVDVLNEVILVLLLVSFYFFIMARVTLAADIYFIPVNYPASEATALHISIVGAVLYLIAIIAVIVNGFLPKKHEVITIE